MPAQHARSGRADRGVPPVQDYAAGRGAGSVGHAETLLCSLVGVGKFWLAGPGDGRLPGPALMRVSDSGLGDRDVGVRLDLDAEPVEGDAHVPARLALRVGAVLAGQDSAEALRPGRQRPVAGR